MTNEPNWSWAETWGRAAMLPDINEGQRMICHWQGKMLDDCSFEGYLVNAAVVADTENLEALRQGFPELVEALEDYRSGRIKEIFAAMMEVLE